MGGDWGLALSAPVLYNAFLLNARETIDSSGLPRDICLTIVKKRMLDYWFDPAEIFFGFIHLPTPLIAHAFLYLIMLCYCAYWPAALLCIVFNDSLVLKTFTVLKYYCAVNVWGILLQAGFNKTIYIYMYIYTYIYLMNLCICQINETTDTSSYKATSLLWISTTIHSDNT